MNYRKEFLKHFKTLCMKDNPYKIWNDLISLFAIEIANSCLSKVKNSGDFLGETWRKREEEYKRIMKHFTKEEIKLIVEMFSFIVLELESNPNQDLLGSIYMELGISNNDRGQFFTPYHLCKLMSDVTLNEKELIRNIDEKGYISINDCAVGAGATLISAWNKSIEILGGAKSQNHIYIVGQDVDLQCVKMAYIQLSLLGCSGYILCGNTLTKPVFNPKEDSDDIWYLPLHFNDVWSYRRLFHSMNLLNQKAERKE